MIFEAILKHDCVSPFDYDIKSGLLLLFRLLGALSTTINSLLIFHCIAFERRQLLIISRSVDYIFSDILKTVSDL